MSLIVPLNAVPKQHLSIVLGDQQVEINVRQLYTGLFMDIVLAGSPMLVNVLCENLHLIVRSKYLGFVGDFSWYDTQGDDDPDYAGIGPGGRFQLRYLTADDVATFGAPALAV